MKRIYFVRHGETGGNRENKFQHYHAELSDTGLTQVECVAGRLKNVPIDVVISSTMKRAVQTGSEIAKILNKKIFYIDHFHEILKPSCIRGKSKKDFGVSEIIEKLKENFNNRDWHHSDEENFFDIKSRAKKAIEYINSLSEKNILIVTHGNFLTTMIALMCFGDSVTSEQYKKMQEFFISKNTGITVVDEHKGEYFLLTWNDYAHLGDLDTEFFYS